MCACRREQASTMVQLCWQCYCWEEGLSPWPQHLERHAEFVGGFIALWWAQTASELILEIEGPLWHYCAFSFFEQIHQDRDDSCSSPWSTVEQSLCQILLPVNISNYLNLQQGRAVRVWGQDSSHQQLPTASVMMDGSWGALKQENERRNWFKIF